jgi:hypothetical protein
LKPDAKTAFLNCFFCKFLNVAGIEAGCATGVFGGSILVCVQKKNGGLGF